MNVFHDGSCSFKSFSNIPDLNPAANQNGCIALGGAQKVSYGGNFGGFDVPTVPTSPLPPETRGISGGLGGVVPGAASHRNDAGTRRWTSKAAWLQLKFQNEPENHEIAAAARRNAVING